MTVNVSSWRSKVYPNIFMQRLLEDFNINAHTCERRAIEIDERENTQHIFIDTSFCSRKDAQDRKQIFLQRFLMGIIFSPFGSHMKYIAIFPSYNLG